MIDREPPATEPRAGLFPAVAFMLLFSTPFAGFGLLAVYKAIENLLHGKTKEGLFFCMFGVVFSGIGFGMMFATLFASRLEARTNARKIAHPIEPWLWRKDWADGRIHSSTKGAMWVAWVFAVFWNSISSGVFFSVIAKKTHDAGFYVGMIFPVVGIVLLVWAIRQTLVWLKFGQSTFKMLAVPGVVGGRLSGAIETSVKIKPKDGFQLKLTCLRRIVTGSGKSSTTTETPLWENEKTMTRELLDDDPRRTGIPVSFEIPADAAESDDRNPRDRVIWRLEARAALPGIDYKAKFDVPVFHTAESVAAVPGGPEFGGAMALPENYQLPAHLRIALKALPDGGTEYYFSAARNLGASASITMIFLFFAAVTVFIYMSGHARILAAAFTLVDVILAMVCINLWCRSSRVTITRENVRLTSSWLGLGSTRTVDARDVAGFEAQGGMTINQKPYYGLILSTNGGTKMKAAALIPDKLAADWLCDQMTKALPSRA